MKSVGCGRKVAESFTNVKARIRISKIQYISNVKTYIVEWI